jgi:hypothetical protein
VNSKKNDGKKDCEQRIHGVLRGNPQCILNNESPSLNLLMWMFFICTCPFTHTHIEKNRN